MRTAFIEQLYEEALVDESIFLMVGDLGFSVIEKFRDRFPDRFLNAGISEQNMAGMAAGLAKEGFKVFIYSIGNFPVFRCLEQIRNDICYHEMNVCVVSVGAGFAYGALGASHHATEDIAVMRAIPNMSLYLPSDPLETKFLLKEICKRSGPAYLRIGRARESDVFEEDASLKLGVNLIRSGESKELVLTSGSITYDILKSKKYSMSSVGAVNNLENIKVFLEEMLKNEKMEKIVVVEEHQKVGGLYSSLCEKLVNLYSKGIISSMPKVESIGLDGFTSFAGSQEFLRRKNHLVE